MLPPGVDPASSACHSNTEGAILNLEIVCVCVSPCMGEGMCVSIGVCVCYGIYGFSHGSKVINGTQCVCLEEGEKKVGHVTVSWSDHVSCSQ